MFLDRDGVVVEDAHYLADPAGLRLLPGAGPALRRLRDAGWGLVLVTNQSGVARGLITLDGLAAIHHRLEGMLAAEGVQLNGIYYCPHLPSAGDPQFAQECGHRKPAPGMLLSAASDLGLRLSHSWMLGDRRSDCEAGVAAGCRTILIAAGSPEVRGLRAADLPEAAGMILSDDPEAPR